MLKKTSLGLLCMIASVSSSLYAIEPNSLRQKGLTMEYPLPPNQPQEFINRMFWTVEAHCTMSTEDLSNTLHIRALAKKGKINDIPLMAGESLEVTIYPEENLKISAESGAKVEITNHGEHTVRAICTT
ncbi:MAG: hypothetical protein QM652_01050 [Legionella sp.]|uniref:hypothetical protein n=1 Tax=Legionella sp. TaxID=459 RepID=UPI0039E507FF